jgi:hypothetical protein
MSVRPATLALIEASLRHDAIYRGYLANHLPMALVALDRMGADDARIAAWAARYSEQLEAFRPSPVVDRFEALARREGAAGALAASVDALVAGVAAGAFHGAIRAAYALEAGSAREMAHALAYWQHEFLSLGEAPVPRGSESPAQVLSAMSRDPRFAGMRPGGRNIAERTAAAAAKPSVAEYAARLDPAQLRLDAIAQALIACYCASGDFTILHGVTGCHAFRMLSPHLREPGPGLRHLWHAVVATYAGCGSPRVDGWGIEGSDVLGWREALALAVLCKDEHDVKFVYSCWCEREHYGDDPYRRAASARVCHALRETVPC